MGIRNYSDLKVFQCLVKVFNVNFSSLLVLHYTQDLLNEKAFKEFKLLYIYCQEELTQTIVTNQLM